MLLFVCFCLFLLKVVNVHQLCVEICKTSYNNIQCSSKGTIFPSETE